MIKDDEINELIESFRQISRTFQQIIQNELKSYNLTFSQAQVLHRLKHHGPQSLIELSRKIETSTSSLSGVVDRLERMDLVSRKRDEKDRRVVWISLSEKSKKIIENFPVTQGQYFRKYIEKMPPEDVRVLTEKVKQFTEILEKGESNDETSSHH